MIEIDVPGYKSLRLSNLVLDYNGTLAVDGKMVRGVKEGLISLADQLRVHVVTADTFGKVAAAMKDVPCKVSILPPGNQEKGKLAYIRELGCEGVVAGGNGRNDRLMLKAAALGFAVTLEEGVAIETLMSADVLFKDIIHALNFLKNPLRVTATFRS